MFRIWRCADANLLWQEKIEAETLLSTIVDLERQKQTAMIEISNREQEMISIKLGQVVALRTTETFQFI